MKQLIATCVALVLALLGFAQNTDVTNLKHKLQSLKDDSSKVLLLISLGKSYEQINLDTAVLYTQQGYDLSVKIKYSRGEALSMMAMGIMLMKKDNYLLGLQTEVKALQIFEKLEDIKGVAQTYYSMGNIYERVGDNQEALNNFLRCRDKVSQFTDSTMLMNCFSSIGYNYYKLDNQDSALKYAQLAYDIARTRGQSKLPWTIALMGAIQDKLGNPGIAMAYYYDALTKANENSEEDLFPYLYHVMAVLYKHTTLLDSAILYGHKAFDMSQKINFSLGVADASTLLADLYSTRDNDKAVEFYKMALTLRDSIFSEQKIKQVQNVTYNEEFRQKELEKQKLQAAEDRKHDIQYAGIGIGLVGFIIVFLLLSHSVMVNEKVIQFVGVVGLLLVFEFINLLLHPFLVSITDHSPLLMLLSLVCIAALLVPVHHHLQKWITNKLVQKNKKLRLAAAKKP